MIAFENSYFSNLLLILWLYNYSFNKAKMNFIVLTTKILYWYKFISIFKLDQSK